MRKDEVDTASGSDLYANVVHNVESLIVVMDSMGRIMEFNRACERLTGYTRKEMLGQLLSKTPIVLNAGSCSNTCADVVVNRLSSTCENTWQTKTGQQKRIFWTNTFVADKDGSVTYIVGTGLDITAVKKKEEGRQLLLHITNALVACDTMESALAQILRDISIYADCDAAAIRLRKGSDFPYVQTLGFCEDFIQQELSLCSQQGNSEMLECVCGRVIADDVEGLLTPLVSGKAFITNNIDQMLSELAKKKLPFKIRNHCGAVGYRSLALIPLCYKGETVGLLQLNDTALNKFDEDDIDFLLVASQAIGTSLVRWEADQARQKSELILNTVIQKANDGFSLGTPDGKVAIYNEAMERISGYTKDEVNQHGWYYLAFPNAEDRRQAIHKARLAMAGKIDCMDTEITCKDGTKKKVTLSITPLEIDGQAFNFYTVFNRLC